MTEPNILMGHKLQKFQDWEYKISDIYKTTMLHSKSSCFWIHKICFYLKSVTIIADAVFL